MLIALVIVSVLFVVVAIVCIVLRHRIESLRAAINLSKERLAERDGLLARYSKAFAQSREQLARSQVQSAETDDLRSQLTDARIENARLESCKVRIALYPQINSKEGFWSETHEVKYMLQLHMNGLPVGPPFSIRQDTFKKVDKELVQQVLQDIAKPMVDAGANVAMSACSGNQEED